MSVGKVSNLSVSNINDAHLFIDWDAAVDADVYQIERQVFNTGVWQILESGVWVNSGTPDDLTETRHVDFDLLTNDIYQYRIKAINTSTSEESDWCYSVAESKSGQVKIGYTFNNYTIPTGKWGVIGTPDDIKYTYLFGVSLQADNGEVYSEPSFEFFINAAIAEFERYLGIVIKRRKIVTQPERRKISLTRKREWEDNDNIYTHEDDPYNFNAEDWKNSYGIIRLNHYPVIKINRAEMYSSTDSKIIDLESDKWIRLNKKSGEVSFFPTRDSGAELYGPFLHGGAYFSTAFRGAYPHGLKFDYDAGYESSDFVPEELRQNIMKYATISSLATVGDGLLAGFSSSSISLDGLSESFSSTQSATSAYFGARIKQYTDEIKEWLKINRYKYANMPLGFV